MSGTREAWANAKQEQPEKMRTERREAPLADTLPRRVFANFSKFRWDMAWFRTTALGGPLSSDEQYPITRWHSAGAKIIATGSMRRRTRMKTTGDSVVKARI